MVGSRTPPVEEVIRDGVNGTLVDFFDIPAWVEKLTEALAYPEHFEAMRRAARDTAIARYDLTTICLPKMIDHVERLGGVSGAR